MSQTVLMEHTRQLLEESLPGDQDLDTKILLLLRAEYMRRLRHYRRIDRTLSQKYGLSCEEFLGREVVKRQGYTWEVEHDAMEWETAVDGIETMERKLKHLGELIGV